MRKNYFFVFVLFVLVLTTSLSSAGLFDWFRIQDSIEITGNIAFQTIQGADCISCFDSGGIEWCPIDQRCRYSSGDSYCIDGGIISETYCEDTNVGEVCSDTCRSLGYECGFSIICGEEVSCGSCSSSSYERCSFNQCVVDCSYYGKVPTSCSKDASADITCSGLATCCDSGNCFYSGTCYGSGSIYPPTGDFCSLGTWYGSKLDATCGNGLGICDSNENKGNCPEDCGTPECTSSSECPEKVCQIKYCSGYECVYSDAVDSTSCGLDGECVSGNCVEPRCFNNEDCDDSLISTKDLCQNIGSYNAVCSNTKITECIDGDGYCPTGCLIETDSDCSKGCGDGKIDLGETCSSCPTDVVCASNQKCSSKGECVLNIIDYDFSSISENIIFEDVSEEKEIQSVVKNIKAESGITFRVDVLDSLPEGHSIPEGKKIINILDIESSDSSIDAFIEFNISEELIDFSIEEVHIYIEGENGNWDKLNFVEPPTYSNGVYEGGVFTEHFSIFLITETEYCGDEIFNSSLEECDESVEGSQNCNSCLCPEDYEPDFEGGCIERIDGNECSPTGTEICTGYNLYECSEENVWFSQGKVIGECSVECLIGNTTCSGETPIKCGSDYKWDSQPKISGKCGYVTEEKNLTGINFGDIFIEGYDPCLEGQCVGNRNNSKEEKNTWIVFLIIGILLMIALVSYLIVKLNDPKNIKKRDEKNPFKYSRPAPRNNSFIGDNRRPVPQNNFYSNGQRRNFVNRERFNSEKDSRKFK